MGNLNLCKRRKRASELNQSLQKKSQNQELEVSSFIQINSENNYTPIKYKFPLKSKYNQLVNIIKERFVIEETNQIDVVLSNYDNPQNQIFLNHVISPETTILAQIQSKIKASKSLSKPLVVGISGPTQSGKTTIGQALKLHMDVDLIQQDGFYDEKIIKEVLRNNWESPDAVNWSNLIDEINKRIATTNKNIIVIDGHQIYYRQEITEKCDIKIYLEIPEDEVYKRRMKYKRMKEFEFRENLIPEIRKYAQQVKKLDQLITIDTSKPIKETFITIVQLINNKMNQICSNNQQSNNLTSEEQKINIQMKQQ